MTGIISSTCLNRSYYTKDVPKGRGVRAPPSWRLWDAAVVGPRGGPTTAFVPQAAARASPLLLRPKNGFLSQQNTTIPSRGPLERVRAPDQEQMGPLGGMGAPGARWEPR